MGGTRPADRPASAGRWGRQASTDHSHEDGERAVDAVLFTVQDPRTTRHRRVPTAHGPATAPENCETRGVNAVATSSTRTRIADDDQPSAAPSSSETYVVWFTWEK